MSWSALKSKSTSSATPTAARLDAAAAADCGKMAKKKEATPYRGRASSPISRFVRASSGYLRGPVLPAAVVSDPSGSSCCKGEHARQRSRDPGAPQRRLWGRAHTQPPAVLRGLARCRRHRALVPRLHRLTEGLNFEQQLGGPLLPLLARCQLRLGWRVVLLVRVGLERLVGQRPALQLPPPWSVKPARTLVSARIPMAHSLWVDQSHCYL